MRSPKNAHLANFFVIVPSLTINFVEAMLQATSTPGLTWPGLA